MRTAFVTVKHQGLEGHFMVGQWTAEEAGRRYPHEGDGGPYSFLLACGWGRWWADPMLHYALVMEISGSPCEGSIFAIGGDAVHDIDVLELSLYGRRSLWEAFLTWLYANLYSAGRGSGQLSLAELPALLDLDSVQIPAEACPDAPCSLLVSQGKD